MFDVNALNRTIREPMVRIRISGMLINFDYDEDYYHTPKYGKIKLLRTVIFSKNPFLFL